MAININKTFIGGQVTATYHRINQTPNILNIEEDQNIYILIESFANEDAYKVNKLPPLGCQSYTFITNKNELISFSGDILKFCYSKLMQLPEFQNATEI
jgi:hypothetical protein